MLYNVLYISYTSLCLSYKYYKSYKKYYAYYNAIYIVYCVVSNIYNLKFSETIKDDWVIL